jgi:hypothetical protein
VIRFSGHVEGPKGAVLFGRACAMGLEGIVSKRIDTPYRSGPFLGWRKIISQGFPSPLRVGRSGAGRWGAYMNTEKPL